MTDTSKPAFPTAWQQEWPGLTLREYAAVHALAGMLANPELTTGTRDIYVAIQQSVEAGDALVAELEADALIAELEKGK